MDNETPQTVPSPSIAERAIDTAADVSRTIEEVTEGLRIAVDRLRSAIEAAQRPGQPLARLRTVTRQAPLTSLAIAFLLGAALTGAAEAATRPNATKTRRNCEPNPRFPASLPKFNSGDGDPISPDKRINTIS